ncbi:MAG TPA: IS21 family transposase, partial [Firmicutes bacterium]|nr:IS21 family transposase [Candidatus Fermentithermobacillaceae bacterium]
MCQDISTLSCPGKDHGGFLPSVPYEGSERTVRRYLSTIRPRRERVYRPVETLPGEQAQADWGHLGFINANGKRQHLYAFSFVLSYSRIRYVQFTTRQDTLTFLHCLQNALEYVGGVPQVILFDNAKTVVSERVGSVIQFNRDLMRFALQYGFKPDACWVYDPESKGKVESTVKYVRNNFFYGRFVIDLETLNSEGLQWCDEVANEKIHGTTGEVPSDRLAEERHALLSLPVHREALFTQVTRNIRKDRTFPFETNHYVVPGEYARKKAIVHVYPKQLEVYVGDSRIAVHERCFERGQLICGEGLIDDRPYEKRRRKDALQVEFEALGSVAPAYLKGLARSRQGKLREQARQILKLAEKYGQEPVHAAMSRADSFNCYSYSAVKRIVETQLVNPDALPDEPC